MIQVFLHLNIILVFLLLDILHCFADDSLFFGWFWSSSLGCRSDGSLFLDWLLRVFIICIAIRLFLINFVVVKIRLCDWRALLLADRSAIRPWPLQVLIRAVGSGLSADGSIASQGSLVLINHISNIGQMAQWLPSEVGVRVVAKPLDLILDVS